MHPYRLQTTGNVWQRKRSSTLSTVSGSAPSAKNHPAQNHLVEKEKKKNKNTEMIGRKRKKKKREKDMEQITGSLL
jgi:hypothetical protein